MLAGTEMVFRGSRYSDAYCLAEETWTAPENQMIVGLTQNAEKTRVTGIVTQPTTPPNADDCASEYCVKCPAGFYCTGECTWLMLVVQRCKW